MARKRKINKSRLATDKAVREAKQAERELYRELAKMTDGPLTDDDADGMIETVDSDDGDE